MNFKPLHLHPLLEAQLHHLPHHYETPLLDCHAHIEQTNVFVDPTRIGQVIANIIGNAAKYAVGSTVVITLEDLDGLAKISIADDGPGIPSKHLDHLFDRFYRVPERSAGVRGSGLGLFICDQIISSHGGKITVESIEGQGTQFFITLPANQVPLAHSEQREVQNG